MKRNLKTPVRKSLYIIHGVFKLELGITIGKQFSGLCSTQKAFQANPDSYNGAVRDNYAWSQNIKDVDVHVQVDFKTLNFTGFLVQLHVPTCIS